MPVVGLVVNLASDSRAADRALQKMTEATCLTLAPPGNPKDTGPSHNPEKLPVSRRIPVVLESKTDADTKQKLRWLNDLPGVLEVQLVSADFSDLSPGECAAPEEPAPPSIRITISKEHPDHVLR